MQWNNGSTYKLEKDEPCLSWRQDVLRTQVSIWVTILCNTKRYGSTILHLYGGLWRYLVYYFQANIHCCIKNESLAKKSFPNCVFTLLYVDTGGLPQAEEKSSPVLLLLQRLHWLTDTRKGLTCITIISISYSSFSPTLQHADFHLNHVKVLKLGCTFQEMNYVCMHIREVKMCGDCATVIIILA